MKLKPGRSLKQKFHLMILPLTVSLFLFTIITLNHFNQIPDHLAELNSNTHQAILAEHFGQSFNNMLKAYWDLIYLGDGERARQVGIAREAAESALERWILKNQRDRPSELADVQELKQNLADINAVGDRIVKLAEKGRKEEAAHILAGEMEPIADALTLKLDQSVEQEEGEIKKGVSELLTELEIVGLLASKDLQNQLLNINEHLSNSILIERYARAVKQQLRGYWDYAFLGHSQREQKIAEQQQRAQKLLSDLRRLIEIQMATEPLD
ncbi:MAG TPA: hypothetical protein VJ302_02160, partial [Blastocatellia bacterium]|nr:hypothetical protein [Blastocatellia bacterium]